MFHGGNSPRFRIRNAGFEVRGPVFYVIPWRVSDFSSVEDLSNSDIFGFWDSVLGHGLPRNVCLQLRDAKFHSYPCGWVLWPSGDPDAAP